MKISISISSSHMVDDPREGARNMIERAKAAGDAGLEAMFIGDHHVTPFPYYQNNPMLGRMLAEWSDKPFGALYLVPLWNPVLLAEQIGTLAAIGQGRFIMQCGLGDEQQGNDQDDAQKCAERVFRFPTHRDFYPAVRLQQTSRISLRSVP